jgi:hypothetical protein
MKSTVKWTLFLAVLALVAVASTSPAGAVTIGDFLGSTARAIGVAPASAEGMRAAGYQVPVTNLDRRLTEGDVVAIGQALGVSLKTLDPESIVTPRRAERLVSFFESSSQEAQATQNGKLPPSAKRRPRSKSPRLPHNPYIPSKHTR